MGDPRCVGGVRRAGARPVHVLSRRQAFLDEQLAKIYQVSFIPVAEYSLVFIVAGVLWVVSLLPPVRDHLHPSGKRLMTPKLRALLD